MLIFAIAIGAATFIENDFGTSSAQKIVFKAWWFELLLLLFCITILVNIIRFRMIQQKRWAVLTFHLSMIVIVIGSGVTRYFGYEGMMHIRENESSNNFISADTYLQFDVTKDGQHYHFDEPVLFATLGNNNWKESYLIDNKKVDIAVKGFIPNPTQVIEDNSNGKPILKFVVAGARGREEYYLPQGRSSQIGNVIYNFTDQIIPNALNIAYRNDSLLIKTNRTLTQTVMATRTVDTLNPRPGYHMLRLRSLYTDGTMSVVFSDFNPSAQIRIVSENRKVKNESMVALVVEAAVDNEVHSSYVYGQKGFPGSPAALAFDDLNLTVSYGAKPISLPFYIKLHDFIMERYPGTNSASSYASEVRVIDDRAGVNDDFRIYMNHILDYGGYRFFQSSFDKDEQGTYLSVNHDFWGTWISYFGYFLLTIGFIISFFSKDSRFFQLTGKIKQLRASRASIILLLAMTSFATISIAQDNVAITDKYPSISVEHATTFSELIVQDQKGRMKPMHTLTRELMRKVSRTESLYDLNADQVILSMYGNHEAWGDIPMIKVGSHEKLQNQLNHSGERASYNDFFTSSGEYLFQEEVRRAYALQPIDRGMYEKELMKVDERVNIASMIYSGRIFRIVPVPDDENNTWVASRMTNRGPSAIDQPVADKFFLAYQSALLNAIKTGDENMVDLLVQELKSYQNTHGAAVIPSNSKIKAEVLLNNSNVFNKLAAYYSLLGLAFLIMLFIGVFKPNLKLNKLHILLFGLVILGFLFHTMGLGIRWYVSGRAPWSNGYESMIYIAWTTTLAGVIFTRKSYGGLAATMILAATILLVPMLSYLDPEITPLVPVLKSYWLTIHVSLEAGSYGFLMLGAIIGLINLILMIFLSEKNKERVYYMVKEMSYISEKTLMGGLAMVSVGTYLGGIWANESWGRYWGWDAKETWALVTILVYAFVLHMRIIPKLKGLYAYNIASLFGWASVIMTYYGVNYYLSGLHSYAAGDPIPIPSWVYIAVVSLLIISALAYWRKNKYPQF